MGFFSEVIAARLRGDVGRVATMIEAQFKSGTMRLWPGVGDVVAGGQTWTGHGGLISVSAIEIPAGFIASAITLTLAGLPKTADDDSAYAQLMGDEGEYRGRRIIIYLQFFDDDWQPLSAPSAVWAGVMDVVTFFETQTDDGMERRIEMACETPFVTKRKPRFGYYTDRDQQARFAGDRGLEYAGTNIDRVLKWPV